MAILAAWGAARWAFCLPLLWLCVMLAWLALPVAYRRGLSTVWLAAGGVVLGASFVVATDHELALRHTLTFVLAALVFGLARLARPTDRHLAVIAVGIAATTVLAFAQAAGGLEAAALHVGLLPQGLQETAAARLGKGRAFGSSALPGHYAALLLTAAPLLWQRTTRTAWPQKLPFAASLVFVAGALYLTRSLAAALVAEGLVLVALLRTRRRGALITAGTVVVLLTVAVAARRGDLVSLQPIHLRLVNWHTAAWVLSHHPLLGVGLGGIGQAALASPFAGENISPYTHNSFLQLGVELGLMGLPLVVGAIAALLALLRDGSRSNGALALAVAVVPVHNLVDFSLYAPEVVVPWAVLAGALAARCRSLSTTPLQAWLLVPVLAAGTILTALEWHGESAVGRTSGDSDSNRAAAAVEAARWTPWAVRPLYAATELAIAGHAPVATLAAIDELLARRYWVQPDSAGWAEARARLLLAQGRRGEALVWVREAVRRRPGSRGLAELEERCR